MKVKGVKFYFYRCIAAVIITTFIFSSILPSSQVHASAAPMIEKTTQNILVGNNYTISVKNKITGASYSWKSSNKSVATVSKKGVVTGIKKGSATITCNVKTINKSYTLKCKVSIRKPADEITISNKVDYLLVGESYDLNRKLNPSASNDITTWSSSEPSVISPDKQGKFTAKCEGVATITATTKSKASDSATIYVVKEKSLKITGDDVVDGKVILKDRSLGDLSIENSVGNAAIELSHVTIGGTLTMEDGAAYKVTTNDSTVNKVNVVESSKVSTSPLIGVGGQISNMAIQNESPTIVAGKGSLIVTIDAQCNISVKQTDGATIQSFSVVKNQEGNLEISLEGFQGDLIIDSQSQSEIKIVTTECDMSSATVKNASEGQKIDLIDTNAGTDKASKIQTVTMSANASLTVNVKTEEVKVSKEVNKADIVIEQPVSKLTNEGNKTSLVINSQIGDVTSTGSESTVSLGNTAKVQNMTVAGSGTKVSVSEGASIQKVISSGSNATIEGSGKVESAVVTGDNSKINTEGTNVEVKKGTSGVSVGGVEVKADESNQTVTPKPTITPSPAPTTIPVPPVIVPTTPPTVTPTPAPTNKEKLAKYNEMLTNIHNISASCVANANPSSLAGLKESLTSLKKQLEAYNNIDSNNKTIVVQDNYLYDYAEYIEFLIPNGAVFGLAIRTYYDSKASGNATLEQAIAAANNIIGVVDRINTDTQFLSENVNAVFLSLEGSQQEFYTALNKMITDQGELTGFPSEQTPYYQSRLKDRIFEDEFTYNLYQSKSKLTFLGAISCFINICNYYAEEQTAYTNSKQYEELVELVLTAMPELTVVIRTDEDGSKHFDHVEFDAEADNSGVIRALQEVFDTVNLKDFLGEDIDSFTVNPICEYSFIRDLGRQISNNETYEGGSFEVLCYYINNKDTLDIGEKNELLYRCIQAILWTTYGIQQWNFEYLDRYQGITDEIIEAAASDDEEAVYQGLVTLYEKKLSDSKETAEEWDSYDKPYDENGAVIDKIYCLELIKSKLEPLSEITQEVPTDSRLYNYIDNKENVSADLLDAAIYDLVDVVGRSHQKALYDLMYVLQGASWSCLQDPNPDNLSEVKNALISLQQRLILGQDMDPAYDGVEIREEYLYDYAEYLDYLIGNGAEKSLPLRQFYESRDTGTQTPELALSAANVVMRLVNRVNTETQILQDFVNPVFQSLEGSQQDFCTALNAIIIEQGEYAECTIEQAQYFQNRLKTRILEDDFTRNYYEGEKALNFFGAISCFLNINLFYGEEQAVYNDFKLKEQLLNNFIEAMPDLNVFTWTDPVDQSIRFDHVEYDTQADMSGVVSAIQAVFDSVELSDFFGDLLTEYTVDPLYADSYIHELARQISNFEQNEEGYYDALYNYKMNYSTMDPQQKIQIVADCIGTILWTTYDKQGWNISYMDRYQATVDTIIAAAEGDDAEALYQGLVTLYGKKLSESEQTAAEWADYEKPFSETGEAIDKAYCLGLVKEKLLPLSVIIDSVPANSRLYDYYHSEKTTAEPLDMAIYDLVDAVRDSYVASYPIQKGLLGNLFTALEAKDAAMTYQALNNIYDYSIATGSTDSIIFGAEYSVVYMKELWYRLLPENGTNDLLLFYQIYPTLTGEERTKEIAEIAERAFWNVYNILTEDGSSWMIDKYSNTDAYQVLVDGIIDAMPSMNVITFQDPVDNSIHFDHVEYDVTANQTEIVNAVQALFDGVNLEQFEMTGLTIDPSKAQQIISELATRISYFEPYTEGSFDSLFVYNSKRLAIDTAEKMYLIQDCVNTILWSVYNIQNN